MSSINKITEKTGKTPMWFCFEATKEEINHLNLSEHLIGQLLNVKNKSIDEIVSMYTSRGISLCTIIDKGYPQLLKETSYPPLVLFYKGIWPQFNELPSSAIVGTRTPTEYGMQATKIVCDELIAHNHIIVSGLAYGIDSIVHMETLRMHGTTVAVVPNNVAHIVPTYHHNLAEKIIDSGGAIISEYGINTKIHKGSFPQRNRIIAGLTERTFITQAKQKSGSLITARFAIEYNRDVYAVPGPITDEVSRGCNTLIGEGAIVYTGPGQLYPLRNKEVEIKFNTTTERDVYVYIQKYGSVPTDTILKNMNTMSISDLNQLLTNLEIRNLLTYRHGLWSTC